MFGLTKFDSIHLLVLLPLVYGGVLRKREEEQELGRNLQANNISLSTSLSQTKLNANEIESSFHLSSENILDEWWKPKADDGITWQLQTKKGPIFNGFDVDMYNVDLFDTSEDIIWHLQKDLGCIVVCHFSAGTYEPWRSDWEDYFSFLKTFKHYNGNDPPFLGNKGNNKGERWLDIRRLDLLSHIMRDRLDLAKRKGCDAVQPNNIDLYTNRDVLGIRTLTKYDQITYNVWLANEAHERNLSVGLNSDVDQLNELEPYFDWAFSDRCFQYHECDAYAIFTNNNKAVFSLQYEDDEEQFCPESLVSKLYLEEIYNFGNYQIGCQVFIPNAPLSQEKYSYGQPKWSPMKSSTKTTAVIPWWQPKASDQLTWQWQLEGTLNINYDVDVYNVDLFDVSEDSIVALKATGKKVVCHFSAGSYEPWRADWSHYFDFISMYGIYDGDGYPFAGKMPYSDERWLDIRELDLLTPIMEARLDLAKNKGCDAVLPSHVDSYSHSNETNLDTLSHKDQLTYNTWLAKEAHKRNLSIGLKNDMKQIPDLQSYFDWALNEQCFQYKACDDYQLFTNNNKAVFGVEYQGKKEDFCARANDLGFSWILKNPNIDEFRIGCEDVLQENL